MQRKVVLTSSMIEHHNGENVSQSWESLYDSHLNYLDRALRSDHQRFVHSLAPDKYSLQSYLAGLCKCRLGVKTLL